MTDFDVAPLADYLAGVLPGAAMPSLVRVPGGLSNPTYFMDFGKGRFVLRKQPPGKLLPSAHAIDREYRVLRALAGTDVPVPAALHYCDDPAVIGTPFYIMERLEGRVFHDNALPALEPSERAAAFAAMNSTLAALHSVDIDAVGLGDFGKRGGFFARQIARWTAQFDKSATRQIDEIARLGQWLEANLPASDETTLTHGDYRLGNLIFHHNRPEVIGVLDWELSTLGHPLSDLGYNLLPWTMLRSEMQGLGGHDLDALGIPQMRSYAASYFAARGLPDLYDPYYSAFAFFRLAVIFEGIVSRAAKDPSAPRADDIAHLSRTWARHGLALAGV